mmetsp:Transcript_93662/g.166658  ORF Transcript_93662/g.166658 Transcript_93662/m.166658 type:complete len:273 (+) Transcript_93662:667-1485(+)
MQGTPEKLVIPKAQETAICCSLLCVSGQDDVVFHVKGNLTIVPPVDVGPLAHTNSAKFALGRGQLCCHAFNPIIMITCFFLSHFFREHDLDVIGFVEGKRHPEMGVGVESGLLLLQLCRKFRQQALQELRGHAEAAQARTHTRELTQTTQQLRGCVKVNLLHLGALTRLAHSDETIGRISFGLPFLCSRHWTHASQDISMIPASVIAHLHRWDKDLISPKDREASLAALRIRTCLFDDSLKDGERKHFISCLHSTRKLHARLVVVFSTWDGR